MSAAKLTLSLPTLADLFALMMFPHRVWGEARLYIALRAEERDRLQR
jgi:hypothetical protein